jgi:hypothetical protein
MSARRHSRAAEEVVGEDAGPAMRNAALQRQGTSPFLRQGKLKAGHHKTLGSQEPG